MTWFRRSNVRKTVPPLDGLKQPTFRVSDVSEKPKDVQKIALAGSIGADQESSLCELDVDPLEVFQLVT